MGTKILVDTDVLIKSYRGEDNKYEQLELIKNQFAISIITACELLIGANNSKQLISIRKELRAYTILHFDAEISAIAFTIFKKYASLGNLKIADSIIAATAIRHKLELYTDNKKDFSFIENIQFYNEK